MPKKSTKKETVAEELTRRIEEKVDMNAPAQPSRFKMMITKIATFFKDLWTKVTEDESIAIAVTFTKNLFVNTAMFLAYLLASTSAFILGYLSVAVIYSIAATTPPVYLIAFAAVVLGVLIVASIPTTETVVYNETVIEGALV